MLGANSPKNRNFESTEDRDLMQSVQICYGEQLSSQEMLQLAHNHEKFTALIMKLIEVAEECISSNDAQEGVEYLIQAEKILEYAASCGKNIDRNLIMSVLHNEAFGYQRMWELPKCSNYLEALIFNIHAKFSAVQTPISFRPNQAEDGFSSFDTGAESSVNHTDYKLIRKMDANQKMRLSKYHLQFSAVNSQLKNHKKSIESSRKAIRLIKQNFSQTLSSMKSSNLIGNKKQDQQQIISLVVNGISRIEAKAKVPLFGHYKRVVKYLKQNWEQRSVKSPEDANSSYFQAYDYLRSFTIGTIMQIKSFSKDQHQFQNVRYSNDDYTIESCQVNPYEVNYSKILQQVLYLCSGLFTLSTEVRLGVRVRTDEGKLKFHMKDYEGEKRQAQIYHLMSLIVYYLYIPFKIDFLTHLQTSFKKNYGEQEDQFMPFALSETDLTKEDIEILNDFDASQIRYFKLEKEKPENAFSQISLKKQPNSPKVQPVKNETVQNINVKKLESKCKKIIGKMYSQEKPEKHDMNFGWKKKKKHKKCLSNTSLHFHNNNNSISKNGLGSKKERNHHNQSQKSFRFSSNNLQNSKQYYYETIDHYNLKEEKPKEKNKDYFKNSSKSTGKKREFESIRKNKLKKEFNNLKQKVKDIDTTVKKKVVDIGDLGVTFKAVSSPQNRQSLSKKKSPTKTWKKNAVSPHHKKNTASRNQILTGVFKSDYGL